MDPYGNFCILIHTLYTETKILLFSEQKYIICLKRYPNVASDQVGIVPSICTMCFQQEGVAP